MTIPQTPEAIAYKLMQDILAKEKDNRMGAPFTRKDILDTYAECIKVVKGL
jgi:hypothetical protein